MAYSHLRKSPAQLVRLAVSGMVILGTAMGATGLTEIMLTTPNSVYVSAARAESQSIGERLYPQVSPAIVAIKTSDGQGSGIIIRPDGLVLTNAHVVGGARTVTAVLQDGKKLKAEVVAIGEQCSDMALVRIQGQTNLPTIALGSTQSVHPGQPVYVVGNGRGLAGSFKEGSISRYQMGDREIQTTVPLDAGDSGSPLLNRNGALIGLNTSITGRVLSFSIPVEAVKTFLQQYEAGKTVHPAQVAIASPKKLTISTNGTKINGKLTRNSNVVCEDGSFYNTYEFQGKAGQPVMIYMESQAFAPYLVLIGPDGKEISRDENKPNDNWAWIRQQLPMNGTYQVIVNSRLSQVEGAYTLSVSPLLLLRDGELSRGNGTLKDGSYYQPYTIEGNANQEIVITTVTSGFTPYLLLVSPEGKVIAETDNVKPDDKAAGLKIRLPRAGSYKVLVSTLQPGSQGEFRLVVQ